MKVIVAIDSFKGCLSSAEAGAAAVAGIKERWPEAEVVCLPVSDGGEGWLEAWMAPLSSPEGETDVQTSNSKTFVAPSGAEGGAYITTTVHDPLLRPVQARYLKAGDLAVIEVAEACGLHLLKPEERNPLVASSRGVGELIADAMNRGCKRFIVGLGGSAVSDAGRGMIEGADPPRGGSPFFLIATDVTNPLYGPRGAAAIFGPQKGATAEMVVELDRRAKAFADENARVMGFDRSGEPGAGAAGGLGYAFMQFFGAEQRSGAELLMEAVHFDELIRDADFIITGEGRADGQTLMGKLPGIVLRHARQAGIPCHLIAGCVDDEAALLAAGFATVRSINPPGLPLSEAMKPEVARRNMAIMCSVGCGGR
jgi:glycerate kinase